MSLEAAGELKAEGRDDDAQLALRAAIRDEHSAMRHFPAD